MNATFTKPAPIHSLRLQILMEAQQKLEIGQRIKTLRDNSAETTRSIGDYVGVGERSVAAWIAGGGLTYGHAVKVAELFDVDIDWLWRGREKGETPDIFATPASDETQAAASLHAQLDRIEQSLGLLLAAAGLDPDDPPSEPESPRRRGTGKTNPRTVRANGEQ